MTIRFIDYSGARPDPHAIKAAGATGVLRYLSEPVAATAWKRIGVAEKNAILAAGLDLILNFEWYEGRMLEGAAAGAHDGHTALLQARALGYPKGASIYFSHDTSARNDTAVVAYLHAAQTALGSEYVTDIYSGIDVVELCISHGVARYGWQTLAWSNGRVGRAHLYQNGKSWFSGGADENVVLHTPLGSWRDHGSAPVPSPAPRPRPPAPAPFPTHTYTVVSGDNLTSIAQHFHTTVSELLTLNPTLRANPNQIYAGQVLHVPGGSTPAPPVVTHYRIVSGDTLSSIAAHFHTTAHQLQLWNSSLIKNPNVIQAGWVIRVR